MWPWIRIFSPSAPSVANFSLLWFTYDPLFCVLFWIAEAATPETIPMTILALGSQAAALRLSGQGQKCSSAFVSMEEVVLELWRDTGIFYALQQTQQTGKVMHHNLSLGWPLKNTFPSFFTYSFFGLLSLSMILCNSFKTQMQLFRLLKGSGRWPVPFCSLLLLLYFTGMSLFPSARSLDLFCPVPPSPPTFFLSLNLFPPTALISLEKKHQGTGILLLASVYFYKCTIIGGWSFGQPDTTWPSAALVPPGHSVAEKLVLPIFFTDVGESL